MNTLVLLLFISIIIIIIIILVIGINYTNYTNTFKKSNNKFKKSNNKFKKSNNKFKKSNNKFKKSNDTAPNGCYQEEWGINSVGYTLTNFPSIENYSYQLYNNNLTNTDAQNIPWNFGVMTSDD